MKTAHLQILLANTYALYLKTQNYHWNVTGIHFESLHGLFDTQYNELAEAVDAIAEHIRMLGEPAPGSFNAFQKHNQIPDAQNGDAKSMIADLLSSHAIVLDILASSFAQAEQQADEVVMDFIIERMGAHRKSQWILRSLNG